MSQKSVCVVVLGDIGRSPRMQYHSLSLAEQGHKVDIVGYGETEPVEEIKRKELINYHYLLPVPNLHLPRLAYYVFKTLWQSISLLFTLSIIRRPDIILVQNPPAIPTLFVCWLYKIVARSKLVIDWHNYAHTILSLSVGKENALVSITEKFESVFGRRADYNFCVTNAMKKDLNKRWGIEATTLYDKPPEMFKSLDLKQKQDFLNSLSEKYKEQLSENGVDSLISGGERNNRPGILVSSTSWTEDEDFSVLLSALEDYEEHIKDGNVRKLTELICFITGKGPLKQYYLNKIKERQWKHVHVVTPWLESIDYPLLLASSDLGVCLHKSSSGLDLPMKVVDMFGCGLPVCAYDFECLNELVQHGKNGYVFKTASELSAQIQNWFENFSHNENQKGIEKQFKEEIELFQKHRWRENWKNVAAPVFNDQ